VTTEIVRLKDERPRAVPCACDVVVVAIEIALDSCDVGNSAQVVVEVCLADSRTVNTPNGVTCARIDAAFPQKQLLGSGVKPFLEWFAVSVSRDLVRNWRAESIAISSRFRNPIQVSVRVV